MNIARIRTAARSRRAGRSPGGGSPAAAMRQPRAVSCRYTMSPPRSAAAALVDVDLDPPRAAPGELQALDGPRARRRFVAVRAPGAHRRSAIRRPARPRGRPRPRRSPRRPSARSRGRPTARSRRARAPRSRTGGRGALPSSGGRYPMPRDPRPLRISRARRRPSPPGCSVRRRGAGRGPDAVQQLEQRAAGVAAWLPPEHLARRVVSMSGTASAMSTQPGGVGVSRRWKETPRGARAARAPAPGPDARPEGGRAPGRRGSARRRR